MLGKRKSSLLLLSVFLLLFVAASFDMGLVIVEYDVTFNISSAQQRNATVVTDGPNISIRMNFSYTFAENRSIEPLKPSGWEHGFNWVVYENGSTPVVTENSTHLFWTANGSASPSYIDFVVPAPVLNVTGILNTVPFYQQNLTVHADNHFTNVFATTNVSENHTLYNLFWYNGSHYVDRSLSFSLSVQNSTANFSGFNTSTQYFIIEGYCQESWSCTAWSDDANNCGTRTCTDANNCGTTLSKPSESEQCADDGGGGGGGGAPPPLNNTQTDEPLVVITPEFFNLSLSRGIAEDFLLTVYNPQSRTIVVDFVLDPESEIIFFPFRELFVPSGKELSFPFTVEIPLLAQEDNYLFTILAGMEDQYWSIPIDIEVSGEPIGVDIDMQQTKMLPTDLLTFNYTIANLLDDRNISLDTLFYVQNDDMQKVLERDYFNLAPSQVIVGKKNYSIELPPSKYEICLDVYWENKTITHCEESEFLAPTREEYVPQPTRNVLDYWYVLIPLLLMIIISIYFEILHHHHHSKKRREEEMLHHEHAKTPAKNKYRIPQEQRHKILDAVKATPLVKKEKQTKKEKKSIKKSKEETKKEATKSKKKTPEKKSEELTSTQKSSASTKKVTKKSTKKSAKEKPEPSTKEKQSTKKEELRPAPSKEQKPASGKPKEEAPVKEAVQADKSTSSDSSSFTPSTGVTHHVKRLLSQKYRDQHALAELEKFGKKASEKSGMAKMEEEEEPLEEIIEESEK